MLDDAAKARSQMEKPSNTENKVDTLNPRWDVVKKVAEERVTKVGLRFAQIKLGRIR